MDKKDFKSVFDIGVFLALALAFWGCTSSAESMGNAVASAKEETMSHDKQAEKYSPVIPSIDASAPSVVETAYFGLG